MTIRNALTYAQSQLVDTCGMFPREAAHEARALVCYALDKDHAYIIAHDTDSLDDEPYSRFTDALKKRISGVPFAYIAQRKPFYNHTFYVDERVLIPRPETEEIIDTVCGFARGNERLLDVGTGSGAIAITLKDLFPDMQIHAIDISEGAIAVAKKNAENILGDTHGIKFYEADYFSYVHTLEKGYDIVVSNPPYIGRVRKNTLSREVLHEPDIALFSGDEGLNFLERFADTIDSVLVSGGFFMLETEARYTTRVLATYQENAYTRDVDMQTDASGKPRFIKGYRIENRT